ncbi:Anthrax Toxin Receptor-Like [Manis pentadactyla]|nr:Anthrax Toxin Receptor-Like [Manis pentadactyla]
MPPTKPYSFVRYKTTEESEKACVTLNGKEIMKDLGQKIILCLNFVEKVQKSLKHRRVKHFGYEFHYENNNVDKDKPLPGGLPDIWDSILEKWLNEGFIKHKPDQLTINQYEPGHGKRRVTEEMMEVRSRRPWVPGPHLFLLLLLPHVLSTGQSLYSPSGWRNVYEDTRQPKEEKRLKPCEAAFDMYIILDASHNAEGNWKAIHQFTEEFVQKFQNPKLRISFITFGTDANTLMPLTSDSNKIQTGLRQLESTVPGGVPNIHKGFRKAREEMRRVYYQEDYNIISLVVALSAGKLSPTALQETKNEAKAARNHGAKIYLVGIKDYSKDQLDSIVERKNQVYGTKGYASLQDIVFPLVLNACNEITGEDAYTYCVGDPFTADFYGPGLSDKKDDIICRISGDTGVVEKEPIEVNSEFVICPAHIFKKEGEMVEIQYSLDKGITFVNGSLKVIGLNCDKPPEEEPTEPATTQEPTTEPTTTQEPTTEPATTQEPTTEPSTTEEEPTEPATTHTEEEPTEPATTQEPTTEPATTQEPTTEPATTEEEPTEPATTQEPPTEPATTQEEPTEPTVPEAAPTPVSPYLIPCLVPALFVLLLLILCIWCCKKVREPYPHSPVPNSPAPSQVPWHLPAPGPCSKVIT